MKIKNPYSKGRYTTKKKLQRKVSNLLIPLINRLPKMKEDSDFEILKRGLNYKFYRNKTVKPPEGIHLDLLSINVSELVPIENVLLLRKGLKKLFAKHKPKRISTFNDPESIDKFCDIASMNLNAGTWYRLGSVEFSKDSALGDSVSFISIYGVHISSSLLMMHFEIVPSSSYQERLQHVIDKEVGAEVIYVPKLRNPLKRYTMGSKTPDTLKSIMIEDLLIELKWRTLDYINTFFPLYFHNNSVIAPSIDTYKIDEVSSSLGIYLEGEKENNFFDAFGISKDRVDFYEISKDGLWRLYFEEDRNKLEKDSLKILCNSFYEPDNTLSNSLESQIKIEAHHKSSDLLPILAIRKYLKHQKTLIATYRNKVYEYTQNKSINYKKLLQLRIELEKNVQILNRIKTEEDHDIIFSKKNLSGMESYPRYSGQPIWSDYIIESTKYLITDTYDHAKGIIKIIDDTLEILNLKTSYSIQKKSTRLTFISLIVAFLSALLTLISLYFTYIQMGNKSEELFSFISNLLT
ncbi:hypothetical protein B4117_4306 [Bacillus mycoides]|uniref:hypothetical protein n=1 Tax=Bacillus mycoides TaxID=1405 RepID=UPI0007ABC60C|nr:hypothetical protein [Bacillus mycoides]KZE04136.1 hypothetical protein B4117_4306 [Bacillus mycoides]